jgi:archaeal flagellar protein FlaJ
MPVATETPSSTATAKAPAKSGTAAITGDSPWLIKYRSFCYRILGPRFDRLEGDTQLGEKLKQAGLNITPGMHRAVFVVTLLIAFATTFVISIILFHFLLGIGSWPAYVLLLTGIATAATAGAFTFLIDSRISNRKEQLDRELPFTLSELSVLASTGTSPIRLMRRMAQRDHDTAMTSEFKTVVYKTDVQGKDLITALSETAKECPSLAVREAFWDLANMIHQGGNLDEYLRNKSDDILKLRRLVQQQFIERLSTFLDMYVSLVLVGVLMIAVAAFLLNAFGSTADGLDANSLLLLLTFGLVPVAVLMTIVLISIAYARAE